MSAATGRTDFARRDARKVSNQVERFIVQNAGAIAELERIKEHLDQSVEIYRLRKLLTGIGGVLVRAARA